MKQGVDYIGVAVGAMMFNNKGELFLTKRSQNCKNERGHWEIPGGSVEYGETLEHAVRREVKEEYGVEVDIVRQCIASDHLIPADKQHWVPTTFIVKIKPGQMPQIMEPDKCDGMGWFALDALPTPLSIVTRIDVERYLAEKNKKTDRTLPCPHCGRYDNRAVTVDAVVIHNNKILLIKRGVEPDAGKWALPGGYVGWDESASEAVARELKEETGLIAKDTKFIEVRSLPTRHPRQTIDIVFLITEFAGSPTFGDDAQDSGWFPIDDLPNTLAFDHKEIIIQVSVKK